MRVSPRAPVRRRPRAVRTRRCGTRCSRAVRRAAAAGRRGCDRRARRCVRRPPAVRMVTRSEPPHLNADGGSVSDWNCENFGCLPARRRSDTSTRSRIGRTNPSGSFARSTSSFTTSRRPAPSNVLRWSAAARAALLARFTRSRVATSSLCCSASGRSSTSSTVAMESNIVPSTRIADIHYPDYAALRRRGVGCACVHAARGGAPRSRAAGREAGRVPRCPRRLPRQAPAGARACGRARDGEGTARWLPLGAAGRRSLVARRGRGDRRRRARVPLYRDPAAGTLGRARARVHAAVRHQPGVPARRRVVARGAAAHVDRGARARRHEGRATRCVAEGCALARRRRRRAAAGSRGAQRPARGFLPWFALLRRARSLRFFVFLLMAGRLCGVPCLG